MKYSLDAIITVSLEGIIVTLDECPKEELDFEDALMQKLHKQLVFLDIKGGRSGEDGVISSIECDDIMNWTAD